MNEIVQLHQKKVVVRTFDIFKGLGYAGHRELKKLIWTHKESFLDFGVLPEEKIMSFTEDGIKSSKRGAKDKSYFLNEEQYHLLVMLAKNSPESIAFKIRINKEFFRMREELAKVATPSPYIEQVRKILLLDAPTEWVSLYPNEYYIALMQLYGKQFTSNNHTPPYCGQITQRWIYDVVLPPELNNEVDAQRKQERKHQWFKDKGREILLKQILDVTGIARQSRDRKEFEARCASMFNNEPFQLMLMI